MMPSWCLRGAEWLCAMRSKAPASRRERTWAQALEKVEASGATGYDRLVVITDEQSHDHVPRRAERAT